MDHNTCTRRMTVLDNINFWSGLSSSKLNKDEIVLLLETFNIEIYQNTKTIHENLNDLFKRSINCYNNN